MATARYEVHARYGTSETSVIGGGWRRNLRISSSEKDKIGDRAEEKQASRVSQGST